jgi:uncharacterized surface protein with fasciclin (FAS1) repeats
MTSIRAIVAATALAVAPLAAATTEAAADNIVETAAAAGSFDTLLAAAEAAGLAEALATTEDITVFAPTDEAFAALPEGTVETLLEPENRGQLTEILTYHVVPGVIPAAEVPAEATLVDTLNDNAKLTVQATDGGVVVGGANVIQADIEADNGVIHVIDAVLIPSQ